MKNEIQILPNGDQCKKIKFFGRNTFFTLKKTGILEILYWEKIDKEFMQFFYGKGLSISKRGIHSASGHGIKFEVKIDSMKFDSFKKVEEFFEIKNN